MRLESVCYRCANCDGNRCTLGSAALMGISYGQCSRYVSKEDSLKELRDRNAELEGVLRDLRDVFAATDEVRDLINNALVQV